MEVTEMSNKLVMSLINKFMVENEENIMEFITHPEGELAQKWIEQGEAVKEYIGYKEPKKDEVVFRPPTIEDDIVRVIHKDLIEELKQGRKDDGKSDSEILREYYTQSIRGDIL
jgi:hypothetical protein